MDLSPLGVRATAGSLRSSEGVVLHHTWTDRGVVAGPAANGGQLLHLSVTLCVLNDTYREAERLGIEVDGVAVEADGGFDDEWRSTRGLRPRTWRTSALWSTRSRRSHGRSVRARQLGGVRDVGAPGTSPAMTSTQLLADVRSPALRG